MTKRNLAICFGPSVMRSRNDDPLSMIDQYDSKVIFFFFFFFFFFFLNLFLCLFVWVCYC